MTRASGGREVVVGVVVGVVVRKRGADDAESWAPPPLPWTSLGGTMPSWTKSWCFPRQRRRRRRGRDRARGGVGPAARAVCACVRVPLLTLMPSANMPCHATTANERASAPLPTPALPGLVEGGGGSSTSSTSRRRRRTAPSHSTAADGQLGAGRRTPLPQPPSSCTVSEE
jgi:hypothetical protein